MEEEESAVEERPSGARWVTLERMGTTPSQASAPLHEPTGLERGKGGKGRARKAAVGLRSAAPNPNVGSVAVEKRANIEAKVRETREEHRQKIWDKLDEARRRAEERAERLRRFEPDRLDDEEEGGFDY